MFEILIGIIGYCCYYIYDFNDVYFGKKLFKSFFMLGSILQIFATIGCIFHFFNTPFIFNIKNWIACLITLFFFVLLIYTLFFSLPFEKTYILQDNHEVYKVEMYALCRHPGVLWYIAFYIALYFSFPTLQLLIASILFCFLNLV